MKSLGSFDVVVCGAGVTGVVAAIAARREGANVLLIEGSGLLGGMITGGRLTKPQGVVQPGIYLEFLRKAAEYGGAKPDIRTAEYAAYSGIFDSEIMQRVIVEMLDESGVQVLLFAQITDVVKDKDKVIGVLVHTKQGGAIAFGSMFVDATGDGDVATYAGAEFQFGRGSDGLVQPMTCYFRISNVDFDALARDALSVEHEDLYSLQLPENWGEANSEPDFSMSLYMRGFDKRIAKARQEGFNWILTQDMLVLKAGRLPGEINVNACRVHGNGLDPWERSRAVIELRKQAYCVLDFLCQYVRGFENASLLDVSPVLGVRETRRIVGEYVLTGDDVREDRRFEDSIGLCVAPIDIHDPVGGSMIIEPIGNGYALPFRCLVPKRIQGLLVAGRCLSVDPVAFGSARQSPVCAISGQAAGIAAAIASNSPVVDRVDVKAVQRRLVELGVVLGTNSTEGLRDVSNAVLKSAVSYELEY